MDKPSGPTSHDVVAAARRSLRLAKVGHAGTLDPFATGLLLLLLGRATRLAEYLLVLPKRYNATLRLGAATDSDDRTGAVIHSSEGWRELDEAEVRAVFRTQLGDTLQLPPRFSAKKVGGERSYRAARRGRELERRPARVTIHRLEVTGVRLPEVDFEVDCSAGTYVRAIARDVGDALGVGGHLTALRRTSVGDIGLGGALPPSQLEDPEAVERALIPPRAALGHLPAHRLDPEQAGRVSHGREAPLFPEPELPEGSPVVLLAPDGSFLAVGERRADRLLPGKVFA